jgi:frataxin-like iron-binding protein CyaY
MLCASLGLRLTAKCCRRDEALAAIQDSIRAQQQQELAIDTEIQGYKKDINKEQVSTVLLAQQPRRSCSTASLP